MMPTAKILIVEDDGDMANMLRLFFEQQGYDISVAGSGRAALEMCRQQLPHVVVLDIMMPEVDGYEVCRRLRDSPRTSHVPIVFLTQKDRRDDKLKGLEMGADDYITKPFDLEELRLRVKNTLARAAMHNLTNPTTGLPGVRLVENQLQRLMQREDWGIISVGIQGFDGFIDLYGFVAADDVLRFVARTLGETLDGLERPDDFIGHTDRDDFIVITRRDLVEPAVEGLQRRFDAGVGTFYDWRAQAQGYVVVRDEAGHETQVDFISLSVSTILLADGPFYDIQVDSLQQILPAATESGLAARAERDALADVLQGGIARRSQLRELVGVYQEGRQFVRLLEETAKLTAHVTHDLGGGLGIIKGTMGLMLQELARDDRSRERLERMSNSLKYCEVLLRDVQELGFDVETQSQPVNLESVLQGAVSLLRCKIIPDIHLEAPSLPIEVYGDEDQLQQAFVNLARGVVASSDEGTLAITVGAVADDRVPIRIASSAFEIAQDQQDLIFDLGFMPGDRGYNVDLFVAKKILTRHNAAIRATSRREMGAEFTISLPVCLPDDRRLTLDELRVEIGNVEAEVKTLEGELAALQPEQPGAPLSLSEVNRLVSGVAGALLNEQGMIKNSVELMLMDVGRPDDEKEHLIRIEKSCQYCELLVRNLLEAGLEKEAPRSQAVDITVILKDVVRLLEGKMPPDIQVRWELDQALPGISGNELQLKQVFMNLVRNALDALPQSGILTIRTRTLDTHVQVQVADTGCGIPDENLDKIFDLQFTTKREGYGIGLHIVQSIVETHGGEVGVESQVGQGTTFTVRLPIKQEESGDA
jgi:signal transduction histidine kinase/DNA-binding NarL/FixJ family response regulator